LERILARDPQNVRALGSLARIYEAAHETDRARQTLSQAAKVARSPAETAELQFRIGKLEADAGDDPVAEAAYRRALEADRDHAGAQAALEAIARGRGDWQLAAELMSRRALAAASPDAALLGEVSRIYTVELKRPEAALPFLERAIKLLPEDAALTEALADLYFALDRLDEALPLYRALTERQERSKARRGKELARLHFRVGAIAEKRGDPSLALVEYASAYQIDGAHTPTLVALGRLHRVQSEWEKARKVYRAMLLQNLDADAGITKADIYFHLGEIHERTGEAPKAIGMYERGLEIDAGHAGLRDALERVKRA
jgi:tetratricopeptide (TPR) repeat protein